MFVQTVITIGFRTSILMQKEFIEKYFLVKYKKDDTLSVEYDYTMIQKNVFEVCVQ